MSTSWFIAKRYFQAQRRAGFLSFLTVITVIGVTLGTAALIITLSVLDGFEKQIKEKVVDFTSHIEVRGFQNKPLAGYRTTVARVKKEIPGVKSITPFAAREGMIRAAGGVDGIFLKGIDPAAEVLSPHHLIVAGRSLGQSPGAAPEIVLGKRLADRLDVSVGNRVVVFALPQDPSMPGGQPRAMQFSVVGLYESGMAEFDEVYAYTDLPHAQKLFQLGDDVTGYDVLVTDLAQVESIAARIQSLLEYPHYARTVFQLYRNLFSWVELQKKLSPVLLSLIILVAAANIIGTMLMFILEKTTAIGILKSIGAGPRLISRIFTLQGMAIGLAGITLGNALALLFCWLQSQFKIISLPSDIYYMSSVPILLSPANFALVSAVAFVLCLVTSVAPARAAAHLDTVAAIRFR